MRWKTHWQGLAGALQRGDGKTKNGICRIDLQNQVLAVREKRKMAKVNLDKEKAQTGLKMVPIRNMLE